MKKVTFENGQPILIKELLDWAFNSKEFAIKERILDLITPGVVYGTGPNGEQPFKITHPATGLFINVGPGVAISPSNVDCPFSVKQGEETTYKYIGERIAIGNDEDKSYDVNALEQNRTTGNKNIPVTAGAINYVWIRYIEEVDTTKTYINKLNETQLITPIRNDGYQIKITTNNTRPGTEWIKLGKVTIPSGHNNISDIDIDQSEIEYANFRDKRVIDIIKNNEIYQRDNHSNGLVDAYRNYNSDSHLLKPHVYGETGYGSSQGASFGEIYFEQLLIDDSHNESIYINGVRGVKVLNEKIVNGFTHAYYSFLNKPEGNYIVYAVLNSSNNTFELDARFENESVGNNYFKLAKVYWNPNSGFNNLQDLREFNLITGNDIRNNTIETKNILSIDGIKIIDNTITKEKIKYRDLDSNTLANNAVDQRIIKDAAVIHEKLAVDAVQNDVIKDYEIARKKLRFSIPDKINIYIVGTLESNSVIPIAKFLACKKGYISKIYLHLDNCPINGNNVIFDVRVNGNSIITGDKIRIDATSNTYQPFTCIITEENVIVKRGNASVGNCGIINTDGNLNFVDEGDIITVFILSSNDPNDGNDAIMHIIIEDRDGSYKYEIY